ncbi:MULTISPECIES: hypothetical protein [unclassified Lentimonas]|uniref:hypothetical protein n=1 Tax=unclassified Lentimonas TaxID=2630993 RepID=UPI00132865C2|nr:MULTISPECIES: hypothetical protein [unclassified Lentimonas]CAA6696882.1 Unannotated [Lentimonas sp. CC10]CAA6696956.1 Unannotated [Lentimonas sp. CC19]CAA7071119.1 Unannotated [Lentimonas sp. CC11]
MKRILITLAALISLSALHLSAATTAEPAEDKKPSWFERIFSSKDTPKEAKQATEESKTVANDAGKDKEADEPDDKASKKEKQDKKPAKDLKFSKEDKEVLEDWQKGNASWKKSKKKLPPGLQKKVDRGGELPPGWKKKLEVGTVLDPAVDEAAVSLPEEILSRLPDIPEDTEIVQVGNEIIRVIESTREIVDILDGFGLGED